MRAAASEEIIETLRFALLFKGSKRLGHAADFMAQIAAEHLLAHLHALDKVDAKRDLKSKPSKK
jgi:hypothetical protein